MKKKWCIKWKERKKRNTRSGPKIGKKKKNLAFVWYSIFISLSLMGMGIVVRIESPFSTFASVGSETICDCVRFVISFSSISIFSLRSAQIIPSHKNVVLECVLCFACQRTSNEEEEVNEAVKNAELFFCCGRSLARTTLNLFDVYKCGCVLCFANKYSFFIFCGCHFMVYWMRNFSKWLIRGSASKVKIFDRHNSHDNVRIACHSFFFFTDNVKHFAVVFSTWNITNREISWIDALLPVFHYFFRGKMWRLLIGRKRKPIKRM